MVGDPGDVFDGVAFDEPANDGIDRGGRFTSLAPRLALVITLVAFFVVLRRASSFLATSASGTVLETWANATPGLATPKAIVMAITRFMQFLSAGMAISPTFRYTVRVRPGSRSGFA